MHYSFTLIPADDFHLKEDQVDIWCFGLSKLPEKDLHCLNEEEKTRANRFYFDKHRNRFTTARVNLRTILGRYLHLDPKDIPLSYGKNGKPYINLPEPIQFNLSHSGNLALLAVSKTHPLGIDLEYFSVRPYQGIAQSLFSEKECLTLASLPKEKEIIGFFHIWAQKEALIKACGLGLEYPTKQFTVPVFPASSGLVYDPLHQKTWCMKTFMPQIACSAALCFDGNFINTLRFGTYMPSVRGA